ncbi:MAG TPA: DMT family transporter [Methanocorpusculum sp.]|nr:DMT family transporter [Methanocorpusculum sp.]
MNKAALLLTISVLITGANGIIASNTSETSSHIVFLRTLIASIFMLALFLLTRHKFTFYKSPRDFIFIAASGLSMGVSWLFLYEAYLEIGVSLATLLFYIGPIIIMVLSPFLFKEKHTVQKLIGFSMVLIGVLLVNGIAVSNGAVPYGIFCGAMSAVFYSCLMIFSKKVTVMKGIENPLFQFIFSFIAVAIYVGLSGGYGFVLNVSAHDWMLLAILGIVNTGFASTLYFTSVPHVKAQTLAVISYLELLSAVIYSAIFLNENLAPLQILGAALIICGALIAELWHAKKTGAGTETGTESKPPA